MNLWFDPSYALGVEKWLEMPRDERIITKTTGKAQFES